MKSDDEDEVAHATRQLRAPRGARHQWPHKTELIKPRRPWRNAAHPGTTSEATHNSRFMRSSC